MLQGSALTACSGLMVWKFASLVSQFELFGVARSFRLHRRNHLTSLTLVVGPDSIATWTWTQTLIILDRWLAIYLFCHAFSPGSRPEDCKLARRLTRPLSEVDPGNWGLGFRVLGVKGFGV